MMRARETGPEHVGRVPVRVCARMCENTVTGMAAGWEREGEGSDTVPK